MATFYQLVSGGKTETWSYGDANYDKYIIEGDGATAGSPAWIVFENVSGKSWYLSEAQVRAKGATQLTQSQFDTYFARIGGHPPSKP